MSTERALWSPTIRTKKIFIIVQNQAIKLRATEKLS